MTVTSAAIAIRRADASDADLESGTDVANGPMRAVNAALGYRELPDLLTFEGPLFVGLDQG